MSTTYADPPDVISGGRALPEGPCRHDGDRYASDFSTHRVLRRAAGTGAPESGEVLAHVSTGERTAFAVALGGEDRRTLLPCTTFPLRSVRVDVPGAGRP